jgi:orotidine-5'-phosphate decarboxylase
MSVDILIQKIKEKNNPSVAGLDPNFAFVPTFIKEKYFKEEGKTLKACAMAVLEFNKGLMDALCDVVPAIKPQAAYYEMYGHYGMWALEETIRYAQEKGMYVIADIKRNDIGTTAQAYATAYLGQTDVDGEMISAFHADAVTVNGYLGTDGIEPFLAECRKGKMIFSLVKTSNPSSGELQDLQIGDDTVYEVMADMVNHWGASAMGEGKYSQVGAVVGATYPEQQKILRARMPKTFFLVPGYGAQGATAKDISHAFDRDGLGAIVNSSRGIMCAYKKGDFAPEQYAEAARKEAIRMRDEIVSCIK